VINAQRDQDGREVGMSKKILDNILEAIAYAFGQGAAA